MLLNVITGFIIPWILAIFLFKDRRFLILVALVGCVIAFVMNELGFFANMWKLYPWNLEYISTIPFNLGFFALYPHYFIMAIEKYHVKPIIAIAVMSALVTVAEFCGFLIGRVIYDNGWNLIFTYLSYFFASAMNYQAYKAIKKAGFLDENKT